MDVIKEPIFATIDPAYFQDRINLVEVLEKDSRLYLGVVIEVEACRCFVPLRSHIKMEPKFKKAGFSLPSEKRPDGGLDFRKLLIINDDKYIKIQEKVFITGAQRNKIYDEYERICKNANDFVKQYIKEVKRGYANKNYLYKFSTLKNYHVELGIIK